MAVLTLLRNGALTGVLAAALGAVAGYALAEQSWSGVLRGLNGVSLALAVWAGLIVLGHAEGRGLKVTRQQELLHGDAQPLGGSLYPWGAILTTALASATCALLWWVIRALLIGEAFSR